MKNVAKEASLASEDFDVIAALAYRESGLQLVAEKTSMIQSRLRHRLRALGLASFSSYAELVASPQGAAERRQMISALTTNVSHFFREKHHFETLEAAFQNDLGETLKRGGRVRVWSAGCSNGQEAASIAMTVLETLPEAASMDFKILATDIDPNVVHFAAKGVYPERMMGGVPENLRKKYFVPTAENDETCYSLTEVMRKMISVRELNLLKDWPMKKQMDVIFCRNVVIYFDLATQNALWPRFRSQLMPGGYLFLGHSERVVEPEKSGFVSTGPTTYRPLST